jgi:hypothetical protein
MKIVKFIKESTLFEIQKTVEEVKNQFSVLNVNIDFNNKYVLTAHADNTELISVEISAFGTTTFVATINYVAENEDNSEEIYFWNCAKPLIDGILKAID